MEKIKKIFESKCGTAFPLAVAVIVGVLLIVAACIQIGIIHTVSSGAQNEVQAVLTNDVENNFDSTYYGIREGTTSGHTPDGDGNWEDDTTTDDVTSEIKTQLGLDDNLKKTDDSGNWHYTISNLKVTVQNPDIGNTTSRYSETATFTLQIPVFIGGNALPAIQIPMTVRSGDQNQF